MFLCIFTAQIIMSQCPWTSWMECLKRNHVNNIEGNNKVLLFVSWCSHLGCIFWRFHCILLVYIKRWGWLVTRNLINHYALLWLVGFQQLWLTLSCVYNCDYQSCLHIFLCSTSTSCVQMRKRGKCSIA